MHFTNSGKNSFNNNEKFKSRPFVFKNLYENQVIKTAGGGGGVLLL